MEGPQLSSELLAEVRNSTFDRHALDRLASKIGTGRMAIEKDFVISIVLALIADRQISSPYSTRLVFRGGTGIKKVYYPTDTRFSEDLDFKGLEAEHQTAFFEAVESLT